MIMIFISYAHFKKKLIEFSNLYRNDSSNHKLTTKDLYNEKMDTLHSSRKSDIRKRWR